jgi:outer membrane lipoprotein-sorting protein
MPRRNSRRVWAVPAAAIVSVVGAGTIPGFLARADAGTPNLPPLSPAEVLAKARSAQFVPFSGTVRLTANLGLPSLGGLGGTPGTVTDLLSGVHDANVWVGGPDQVRIALPAPLAETNWIRNGNDVWAWDSSAQQAVHASIPVRNDGAGGRPDEAAASPVPDPTSETPADFAQALLAKITPTTAVSVDTSRFVAGRPAYELVISPRSATSTIGTASVSIDAATGLPLDVRVTPRNSATPAFEFGFTHLALEAPAASNFTFTPPPGAAVVQATDPTALLSPGVADHFGRRFGAKPGPGRRFAPIPKDGTGTAPIPKDATGTAPVPKDATGTAPLPKDATTPPAGPPVTTIGTGWDTVAVISGQALPRGVMGLLDGATQVTLANGVTGRLITTPLVSVLVLDDGRLAVGAVTPEALEHAVAGR